jgi:hypothetical protein
VAKTMQGSGGIAQKWNDLKDNVQGSQAWSSIFRPGSIFRKGYSDSPRNRSYVIMNSVLYHLHPVKVKRHAVKVSYTLCLGGLSFFLFILLTVTGIFLMFFYRPTAASSCATCTDGARTSWCCRCSFTWPASSTTAPTRPPGSSTG